MRTYILEDVRDILITLGPATSYNIHLMQLSGYRYLQPLYNENLLQISDSDCDQYHTSLK